MAEFPIPSRVVTTLTGYHIFIDNLIQPQTDSVVLSSDNSDAGSTPTHNFRAGNVVILRTSTGEYVEADDSNADAPSVPSVSAAETADSDWQSATITVTLDGGVSIVVTLAASDDTDAEVVTKLNVDFAANSFPAIADVSATLVRIRSFAGGATRTLHVTSDLATAYGAAGLADNGTDPDVRVTMEDAWLKDVNADAIDGPAKVTRRGHFDESELIVGGSAASSTGQHWVEAKAVLIRNGSKFG